jgi:methenyltetrahydrofolate cyclohydrolase
MSSSFLDRTVGELLDLFAAGKTTPGAGSAAALAGALAGSLVQAVARYTIQEAEKGSDVRLKERAEAFLTEAEARTEDLRKAVDEDAEAFERYWRQGRAAEDLRQATWVPIGIAGNCLHLGEVARALVDDGFKNARGEAATAALSAVAQGEAALEIARLNLKAASGASWLAEAQDESLFLRRQLRRLRESIGSRLQSTRTSRTARTART